MTRWKFPVLHIDQIVIVPWVFSREYDRRTRKPFAKLCKQKNNAFLFDKSFFLGVELSKHKGTFLNIFMICGMWRNISRTIIQLGTRRLRNVARVWERGGAHWGLEKNPEVKLTKGLGVGGNKSLKLTRRKSVGSARMGLIWLRIGTSAEQLRMR
jgi:hypothetical protein